MKALDLFSGIGGFSLGFERAGIETVAFCEYDEHATKILNKHWPDVPVHKDIRDLDGNQYRGTVDIVCGGFPCQDLSTAGNKAGFKGKRSSLYREMLRVISECQPRYAVFENVTGLLTGESGRWFAQFLYDLASIGYDAEWHCIPASHVGAHHRRDRVWIISYPNSVNQSVSINAGKFEGGIKTSSQRAEQSSGRSGIQAVANAQRRKREMGREHARIRRLEKLDEELSRIKWEAEPGMGRVVNGIPNCIHRLRRLGNAVIPQIPEAIGNAILKAEAAA